MGSKLREIIAIKGNKKPSEKDVLDSWLAGAKNKTRNAKKGDGKDKENDNDKDDKSKKKA